MCREVGVGCGVGCVEWGVGWGVGWEVGWGVGGGVCREVGVGVPYESEWNVIRLHDTICLT